MINSYTYCLRYNITKEECTICIYAVRNKNIILEKIEEFTFTSKIRSVEKSRVFLPTPDKLYSLTRLSKKLVLPVIEINSIKLNGFSEFQIFGIPELDD